jgi:hypothetical protein
MQIPLPHGGVLRSSWHCPSSRPCDRSDLQFDCIQKTACLTECHDYRCQTVSGRIALGAFGGIVAHARTCEAPGTGKPKERRALQLPNDRFRPANQTRRIPLVTDGSSISGAIRGNAGPNASENEYLTASALGPTRTLDEMLITTVRHA